MRTTQKPTKARRLEAPFRRREFKGDEVLQIKGVSKSFGGRRLFEDVYLRVEGGERIALLGENGTGKTTLLNMIVGLDGPDTGMIRLGPSVKAAYLPQVIHFDHPERSILDTMLYELDITPQSARNRLAAYQFTGEDVFKSVSVLSGGELSRLRLCMLMDESINLLILDEPTNHLDIDSREWLEQAVEDFDGTLLFVSHDRYFINRFATRVWELEDRAVTDYPMGFMQYRQVREEARRAAPPAAVPAQPKKPALSDVTLQIFAGEFIFLVGHYGSGKSTFIRLLTREIKPTSGKIYVADEDLTTMRNWRVPYLRRNIGCVFQDFTLLPNKTVFETVAFALEVIGKSRHVIKTQVPEVLRLVGLSDKLNSYPDQLSGGQQQRVSIARAIVNRPPLLICDEPTGNLDPQTSRGIMDLLERINRTGTTVLVATHDREMVDNMRRRVIALDRGHLTRDQDRGVYGFDV